MRFEVEQKFQVEDLGPIERELRSLGADFGDPVVQVDTYLSHPSRDLAQADEALRMRLEADEVSLTYKGPKIDAQTKSRREIEIGLGSDPDQARLALELFASLGFDKAIEVRKQRRQAYVEWEGARVGVALDEVDGLGPFVELELISEEDQVPKARAHILSLASHLKLRRDERRSYCELLTAARATSD